MLRARYASVVFVGMISVSLVVFAQQENATSVRFEAAKYAGAVRWRDVSPGGDEQGTGSSSGTLGSTATVTVGPSGGSGQDVVAPAPSRKMKRQDTTLYEGPMRPFSKLGVSVNVGSEGFGFDLATPLMRSVNLRGGADFFSYSPLITEDGVNYSGTLNLKSGHASVDWFPMHGGFHISPGVLILKTELSGAADVSAGSTFTLNDTDYTSEQGNPIHGTGRLDFARAVSPALTIGWGNIIPRSGKHWSVPFEIGAAYIGHSQVSIALQGGACTSAGCGSVTTDPDFQSNVVEEQNELNEDLKRIQVYPILRLGVSYKF